MVGMLLALFLLIFPLAALCGLMIYGYRARAHSAEARANRAEGALEISQHNLSVMAEITRECVKDIGLNPKQIVPDDVLPEQWGGGVEGTTRIDYGRTDIPLATNYTPQVVANCVRCGVSVRHPTEAFPLPCPACQTLIDPVLDNPPELG